ncbi:hypothetical protein F5Y16DRAFT_398615 [Xylariaceae sp. FL0255]|nr:hypothetical protein F5Y16DRAFT_398615 [Xylariaceae sp. FL0255]
MRSSTLFTAVAPTLATAIWYDGAPECAQSCLSSAFATGTVTSWWPQESEYCDAGKGASVGSCIQSDCTSTGTVFSSYSSLSSSLCAEYASCTNAGSTGVQTITYPAGPISWAAPGGWGKFFGGVGRWGGPNSAGQWGGSNGSAYSQYWSAWASAYSGSATWTGGVATVTGCAFAGSPWFVGPNCGWNEEGGFNGWVGWGSGWSWGPTQTTTISYVTTNPSGSYVTETGVSATVAVAYSGTLTTSSIVGKLAQETGGSSAAAAGRIVGANVVKRGGTEGSIVTILMAFALGTVMLVACVL